MRKVQTLTTEIPNFKDPKQWLPGGDLKNQTFPGGELFSTLSLPALAFEARNNDFSVVLLGGYLAEYLNPETAEIYKMITGGEFLDLMSDDYITSTNVIYYDIVITDEKGNTLSTRGGELSFNAHSTSINTLQGKVSLDDIQDIYKNRFNLAGALKSKSLINVAVTIFEAATAEEMTFSKAIASGVMGSAIDAFSSQISKGVIGALNLSGVNALVANGVVGLVVGELFEMALGLDNSFGYGGEYDQSLRSYEKQIGVLGLGGLFDRIGFGLGFKESLTKEYTSYDKMHTYGHTTEYQDGSMFGNMDGYSFSGLSKEDAMDHYSMSIETDIMNTYGFSNDDMDAFSTQTFKDDWAQGFQGASPNPSDYGESGAGVGGSGSYDAGQVSRDWARDASHDGSVQSFHDAHQAARDAAGENNSSSSGRHCCTVLVRRKIWRMKKLKDLGEWDKKQNRIWRVGYQIGGKMVAKYYDQDQKILDYTKMMDAFYDTHILKKKRTIHTLRAEIRIYSAVYITGVYKIAKDWIRDKIARFKS